MAAKLIAAVCLFALFNVLHAQCLNRIPGLVPGCGPNILPVAETIRPNQVILAPNYPSPIMEMPYETIVSNPVVTAAGLPATTIIQDSTVANNLANALQLLVVSNLLSNTLPLSTPNEIVIPSYGPALDYGVISPAISPCGYSPYNYIY